MIQLLMISLLSVTTNTANEIQIDKVEREARRFRIHAYENFRQDREEYDRRIEAGRTLLETWQAAKHPQSSAEQLEEWFAAAREVEKEGVLPEAPVIELVQIDEPNEVPLTLSADAPEGVLLEERTPTIDPTTDDEDFTISRVEESQAEELEVGEDEVSEGQLTFETTEFSLESDGISAPPWTPASWRSLGSAVWVGVEASFEQPTP